MLARTGRSYKATDSRNEGICAGVPEPHHEYLLPRGRADRREVFHLAGHCQR
jgi:hypothetical protein